MVNYEILSIILFLILNLIVGISYGRKVKTVRDYAIGDKNFSTGVLVSTIIATWISGQHFSSGLAERYKHGLILILCDYGMIVSFLLIAFVIAPRMKIFMNNLSIADVMGDLFGKNVKIISGIASCIRTGAYIGSQFKIIGFILAFITGLDIDLMTKIAAIVIIVYSAFGGIRSVTFTDVLQFFTFGVVIPILGVAIWQKYNLMHSENFIIPDRFNIKNFIGFSNPNFWRTFSLFIFACFCALDATMFQRILMAKDVWQVKRAFIICSGIMICILLSKHWISYLVYVTDPDLEYSKVVPYIIGVARDYNIHIFVFIGIISMCMSTADSAINASTVLITNDVLKPLKVSFSKEYEQVIFSKLIAVFVGGISLYVVLSTETLFSFIIKAQSYYMPTIPIPLLFAILGFRTTQTSILTGIGAGVASVIIMQFANVNMFYIVPIAMATNALFMFATHYGLRQEGGWIAVEKVTPYRPMKDRWIEKCKNFKLIKFLKETTPDNEITYSFFGLFALFSIITTIYSFSNPSNDMMKSFEFLMIAAMSFVTYPIWPVSFKREIILQICFLPAVFILLIVAPVTFLFMSDFNFFNIIICTFSLLFVIFVVRDIIGILFLAVGLPLVYKIYQIFFEPIQITVAKGFIVFYSILFIIFITAFFIRPYSKRAAIKLKIQKNLEEKLESQNFDLAYTYLAREEFVARLASESIDIFNEIHRSTCAIGKNLQRKTLALSKEELDSSVKKLIEITQKLKYGAEYLSDIIEDVRSYVHIDPEYIEIGKLIDIALYNFNLSEWEVKISNQSKYKETMLDIKSVTNIIEGFIEHGMKNCSGKTIDIAIQTYAHKYKLSFTDDIIDKHDVNLITIEFGQPNLDSEQIKDMLGNFSSIANKEFIKYFHIAAAHYGMIDIRKHEGKLRYEIILSAVLKDLRPKKKDFRYEPFEYFKYIAQILNKNEESIRIEVVQNLIKIGIDKDTAATVSGISKKLNVA